MHAQWLGHAGQRARGPPFDHVPGHAAFSVRKAAAVRDADLRTPSVRAYGVATYFYTHRDSALALATARRAFIGQLRSRRLRASSSTSRRPRSTGSGQRGDPTARASWDAEGEQLVAVGPDARSLRVQSRRGCAGKLRVQQPSRDCSKFSVPKRSNGLAVDHEPLRGLAVESLHRGTIARRIRRSLRPLKRSGLHDFRYFWHPPP